MLHLDPGIHLQEVEVEAFRIDDEFHRTGASVARGAAEVQCRIGHPRLDLAGQPGRRAFLDHLLEAPLKRAVPFEEVHGVAVAEAENLYLDMARLRDEPFQDRKSSVSGKRWSVRVNLGGRWKIKKK